jgi:hypothetical protein
VEVKQQAAKVVKDIFVEIFVTGQPINSDTISSIYSLKPGTVEFKLPSKVSEAGNLAFFKANLLQNL